VNDEEQRAQGELEYRAGGKSAGAIEGHDICLFDTVW
jgi:hypothetical protein